MDDDLLCPLLGTFLCGLLPTALVVLGWLDAQSRLRSLSRRLDLLERRALLSEPAPVPSEPPPSEPAPALESTPEPTPEPPSEPLAEPTPPAAPPRPPPTPWVPPSPERVVVWLAAGFGGLALLLTPLLALVAAVDAGWIGPVVRTVGALVGGTVLWVGGSVARRRWPWVGQALTGAGIGTLYGGLYAAGGRYLLVPSWLAAVAMVAVTTVGTARAVRDRDRFVAWLSLVGGVLTPVLVSTGENKALQLFLYLAFLALGVLAAAVKRGWWDLVLGTGLGVCALYLGWTVSWYTAAEAPVALLGAGILSLPFALAAATGDSAVRAGATTAVLGLVLLALPWVLPVDPLFVDPRSGLTVLRTQPLALPLVTLALVLLPLPLALVGRWKGGPLDAAPALFPAILLPLAAVIGWTVSVEPAPAWLAAAATGPLLALAVATFGSRNAARAQVALLAVTGMLILVAASALDGPALAGAVLALVTGAVVLAVSSRAGEAIPAAVAGLALASLGVAGVVDEVALRYVVGPALVALAVLGHGPARSPWTSNARLAWGSAALTGIAVFPVLYRAWSESLGDAAIGLLPVLLGLDALLVAAVVQRRARLDRGDAVVAVQTLVVLLGVTVAVPLELQERWLTVAWALEAAALAAVSHRVRHPLIRWTAVALCAAVGLRLLVNPWALAWGSAGEGWPVLNWTLYTWGVPALCIAYCARFLPRDEADDPLRFVQLPLGILALLVGFGLVNVEVSHAFQDAGPLELVGASRLQTMVRSASWAAYGLAVLGGGLWRDARVVRLLGFAFVLLATVKVFAYDLWDLTGFVRVGSVGCLAVALVVAAFAFERLVLRGARSGEVGR